MFAILSLLIIAVIVLFVAFAWIAWIALGCETVNGDPERDAGATDDEIERLSRSWDHGSRQTICRPNLEHARALNRRAMTSDIRPL